MEVNLSMLLRSIARDLKIKDKEKWIKERLAHCQVMTTNISNGYNKEILMLSRKDLPFGVVDKYFDCAEFVLFISQYIEEDKLTEYQVITFNEVDNHIFVNFLEQVLRLYLDNLKVFQLYYKWKPVNLRLVNKKGTWQIGDYLDEWDRDFELIFDFYEVVAVGDEERHIPDTVVYRTWHKESLEKWLIDFRDLSKDFDETCDNLEDITLVSDKIKVRKDGKDLSYKLVREDKKFRIEWVEQDEEKQE